MTISDCCGRRPRDISIDLTGSSLTLVVCSVCERNRWYRDGVAVVLQDVTEAAAARYRRRAKTAA